MGVTTTVWVITCVVILGLFVFDFFAHVRVPHEPTFRESATWSAVYIMLAVVFGLVIWWRWGGEWHLVLRGLRLELVKIADGWVPTPFARLAVLADVRDTVALLAEDPRLVSLDITDSGVVWSTPDGERLSAVDGLSLSMRPVLLGERPVRLFEVSARSVFRTGGVKGRLLRRMWVTTQENPYLEVDYRGVWEGDDSTARDWWSSPAEPGKQGKVK